MKRCHHKHAGFTLIEIVVSLLLMAILSTAFVPMVRMSQQRTAQTLMMSGRMYALQNQMEILIAAYAAELNSGGDHASFQPLVPGLLASGINLEMNDFVDLPATGMEIGIDGGMLLVSISDANGYRLRRVFAAN